MLLSLTFLCALMSEAVHARTVHSVVVFSRHGDRTSKFYKGYQMTNLGAAQCFSSGGYYRDRYITEDAVDRIAGISTAEADHNQLWASAPDQPVLFQTAVNFLQGLYPPLGTVDQTLSSETLANGTSVEAPLDGYQYVHIQGEAENAPDTIWLKGDDECPAWTNASKTYKQSAEYRQTLESSEQLYSRFVPLLGDIMGAENVSYAQAYNIFDLLNTASVQNASVAGEIRPDDLDRTRYLANEWEWNMNFNASNPDRSIGGMSLAGGILRQLEAVVEDKASTKFGLMTGSYDTFMAFFGLVGLPDVSTDFQGLPNYASTMAFELYSESDDAEFPVNTDSDLRVRFLFRNGTDAQELTAYPLYGESQDSLAYGSFTAQLRERAITSVEDWCSRCAATADFCSVKQVESASDSNEDVSTNGSGSGLSNAASGGIGAGVTLAIVALVGILVWALRWRRGRGVAKTGTGTAGKIARDSESGSEDARV